MQIKTTFTDRYGYEKIMNSIYEALKNRTYVKQISGFSDRLEVKGKNSDNIEIAMIVDGVDKNILKIKTAYPYYNDFEELK